MIESDDLYRRLVEELRDYAVVILDVDGRIVRWNAGAERTIGYAEGEIVGRPVAVLFTPEDRAAGVPEGELRRAAETGRASDVRWHVRKDGRRFWAEGVMTVLRDAGGGPVGFAKILHDRTAEKLGEDRMAAQYAVTVAFAGARTLDEAAADVLAAVCQQLGWEWGALWVVDDGAGAVLRCVRTHRGSAEVSEEFDRVSCETPLPRGVGLPGRVWASGEVASIADVTRDENFPRAPVARTEQLCGAMAFPVSVGGRVLGVMEFLCRTMQAPDPHLLRTMAMIGGLIGQVLQRRRAEEDLRGSESVKSAILDVALDCIVSMDHEGFVTEWNPAAERTFGYRRDEAVGRQLGELIVPAQLRRRHYEGLARYVATGVGRMVGRRVELTGLRKDGGEFPVELAITRVPVPGPPLFTAYLRDITVRKRDEERVREALAREREARRAAEEASRMKDEFVATVSHELRTPLTAMLGWARLLRDGPTDAEMLDEGMAAIERNARAQAQLVEDLLDVSRVISGKLRLRVRPIDLGGVVAAAAETVRPTAAAKGVEVRAPAVPPAGEVRVDGDPDRLQQVVWNLLANAVKFTDKGGRVEVSLGRDGSQARLVVADTGCGIEADFLPYVFERFRQADSSPARRRGGLGLGLSIVRHLVEAHGGTVAADSAGPGRGATFTVLLPLTAAPLPAVAAAGDEARRGSGAAAVAGLHVLVVDDEEDARGLVAAVLGRAGARVTSARSAAEAIRAAEVDRPDVMVSDIGMPEEDGLALIRRLRERGVLVPAVALTAYAGAADRSRALSQGYRVFMTKPVEPAELVQVVAELGRDGRGAG